MSSITLSGNVSGTGTFTLASPNSNTNRTLNLPDAGGTMVLDSATQTLTNKTIQSSTIQGGAITADTAKASTSGTFVDFTSIPSWVKRITVMLGGVSTNGTSNLLIQLGTSSGIVSSGYASRAALQNVNTASTAGFIITNSVAAASTSSGAITVALFGANLWVSTGVLDGNANVQSSAGNVTLGATLDRIRITTVNGTDAFDAGSINILYEG